MTAELTRRVLEWRTRGELTELRGDQIFVCRHARTGASTSSSRSAIVSESVWLTASAIAVR